MLTITTPEKVKLWQYGSDLLTTWQIGSSIEFITKWEGNIFKQWGKVLEFNPNESLKYSLFAPGTDREDKPENYFIMKYILAEEDGKIILEIIQEDNRPDAVQEEPNNEENPILQLLKEVAENHT
jgi:hypothetical protein